MLICFQIILQFEVQQGGKIFIDNLGKEIYKFKCQAHLIEIFPVHAFVCYWYLSCLFILGPCALDEIFFPYSSNSEKAIGSCFNIKSNGKVSYNEVDDVCLAEYGKGSKRSPFSKRDQEYRLLEGMISFFEQRPLR